MTRRRVIVLGLDGYDPAYGESLMEEGALPNLKLLRDSGMRFQLDHGADREVGLPWEQFATGLSSADGGRQSPVRFDPASYEVTQPATTLSPFASGLPLKTLVFDVPGFDIRKAPGAMGFTGWGPHAPALAGTQERPGGLMAEVARRFGPYAAADYIHSITWYDEDVTARAAAAYLAGLETRAEIAAWLLTERCPDWDLAIVIPSELHSAAEAFWHGVDPSHPLHHLPTARASAEAMRTLYVAADRFVARLRRACPSATLVIVAMHGMGANKSDLPSMAILPELLYRNAFGISGMRGHEWRSDAKGTKIVEPGMPWDQAIERTFYWPEQMARDVAKLRGDYARYLGLQASRLKRKLVGVPAVSAADHDEDLDWMIAAHYQFCWRDMPFFALPSYHDGRVRVNLKGRERHGMVALDDYGTTLDRIEALISECVDPTTGRSVAARFERPASADPMKLDDLQSDLLIHWAGAPTAFVHPRLGTIGPLPYRRPGGHTGGHGAAFFVGDGIARGNGGVVSSFDVVPTLLDLLEERPRVSGRSHAAALTKVAAPVQ